MGALVKRRCAPAGACIESLEERRLMTAAIGADKSWLIFNDPVGGGGTSSATITFRNTGTVTLSVPKGGVSIVGTAASQFHITAGPTSATTIAPGAALKVSVNFAATQLGPKGATLRLASSATNTPITSVTLRGLGTRGLQGANEPSLQWILDAYQIPVKVGDSTPAESTLDDPPKTPNNEVKAQLFTKAGPGSVRITPIAVFSNNATPALTLGYYTLPSTSLARHQLFTVPYADAQTVNPRMSGLSSFDPGTQKFGLYTTWAAQNNRTVYSEDFRNTFISPASKRRMFRAYPLKNPNGTVVANAYVIGNEEAFNHDYQDGVYIIRNVKPVA